MRLVGEYWVDSNNNRWIAIKYTKENAIAYSKTLINCHNCAHCSRCTNCTDCQQCTNCIDCVNCRDCMNCLDCVNCTRCKDCNDCNDLTEKLRIKILCCPLNKPIIYKGQLSKGDIVYLSKKSCIRYTVDKSLKEVSFEGVKKKIWFNKKRGWVSV